MGLAPRTFSASGYDGCYSLGSNYISLGANMSYTQVPRTFFSSRRGLEQSKLLVFLSDEGSILEGE